MKTHKVLLLALIVSAVLSVSTYAGSRKGSSGSHAAAAPARASAPAFHSGSGSQFGGGRMIGPSQHFSSNGMGSMPSAFRQQHINSNGGASFGPRQFTPETLNRGSGLARFENNRARDLGAIRNNGENHVGSGGLGTIQNNHGNQVGSIGNGNRGGLAGANANNHVFAQHSANWHRDWDRHCDHWWHGHRCRFVNNSWFIFDLGFFPWYGYPYDYYASDYYYRYPYGYDPGVYEGADYYSQGVYQSSDQYTDSTVAAAQERLAREGYYRGAIDGVLGRGTHRAILRYQSDHGLRVTGYLTTDTLRSLGLRRVANY